MHRCHLNIHHSTFEFYAGALRMAETLYQNILLMFSLASWCSGRNCMAREKAKAKARAQRRGVCLKAKAKAKEREER